MPFKLQKPYLIPHLRQLKLKEYLNGFLEQFDYSQHVSEDPLSFVHLYQNPKDQEVVALLASSFAYGRVDQILKFLSRFFKVLGPHPYEYILKFNPEKDREQFHGLIYRFYRGRDIACFLFLMKQVLSKWSSLEKYFLSGSSLNYTETLSNFSQGILSGDVSPFYSSGCLPKNSPVRFFLTSPQDGSTCKRLNLFLRWMVRGPDNLDLGLWKNISPSELIIPLDTHIARISRYLGLTSQKNLLWKTALEITQNLKILDPEDPLKYDFAICHLGISGDCPSKPDLFKCQPCPLKPVCRCWENCSKDEMAVSHLEAVI